MAGLTWAGRAEPVSWSVTCPGRGGERMRGRCSAVMVVLNHLIISSLCFVSGAQRGQVHAPGVRGSGSLTVRASATSPPSLPRRADSQLGPWAPWQDLPEVLGGSGFAHVPCGVSGQLSPAGAARTTARGAPQGSARPLPSAVSVPLGEACPPRAEAVGLCAGGRPVPLPTSGRGTAGSRGGGCLGASAPTNIKQAIAPHQERQPGEHGRKASQNLQWRLSWTRPVWAPSPGAPALQPSRGTLGLQGSPGPRGGGPRRGLRGHRAGGVGWRRELGPERLSGTSESGLGAGGAAKPCLVNRGLGDSEGGGEVGSMDPVPDGRGMESGGGEGGRGFREGDEQAVVLQAFPGEGTARATPSPEGAAQAFRPLDVQGGAPGHRGSPLQVTAGSRGRASC